MLTEMQDVCGKQINAEMSDFREKKSHFTSQII